MRLVILFPDGFHTFLDKFMIRDILLAMSELCTKLLREEFLNCFIDDVIFGNEKKAEIF